MIASVVKRAVCAKAAAEGVLLRVAFDPRAEGVNVHDKARTHIPSYLKFNYPNGTCDLKIDDRGIREPLCFGGLWVPCFVPWNAVLAVVNDESNEVLVLDVEEIDVLIAQNEPETQVRTIGPPGSANVLPPLEKVVGDLQAEIDEALDPKPNPRPHGLRLIPGGKQ